MVAVEKGWSHIISQLLNAGANTDLQDEVHTVKEYLSALFMLLIKQ